MSSSPPRYIILTLDDAKLLELSARGGAWSTEHAAQMALILDRIGDETGADITDIVDQLKQLPTCMACRIEGQERSCNCLHAQKLGRRLSRLVDRANYKPTA